ncbi:hypothetical protein CBR_g51657 [Chara braunii]|uniref:Uncharacterized protein n=1 Tax=Chara braunii TaxID=69332 RepID=A0A388M968_CHABU|nr:hypothetical protein CBR_g51657 [Chara braunii]|eukprot:GBG90999.1 hypothetical protein CBR_g51657 [Chara braunii]
MWGVQQSCSDAAHPVALPRSFTSSGHDNTSAVPVAGVFVSDPVHRTEETAKEHRVHGWWKPECMMLAALLRSHDPIVVFVDGHYDSSRDAQHCTVTTLDLKSGMIVGTETMLWGSESSWKLETQCVDKLLHRLKDEKNLIIVEVVHDDCGAVDVILRQMNIDSQKCMWHKTKTLVKRLREAVRGTKTVKPAVVGACEHVREVKCFTKKELELWLETKCVHMVGVSTKKKDELIEIVWGVLFPDEAGKALPNDVVEIDALQTLHCNAAEEAKEWLYGACRLRERARDDDDDVLATHVQHLANHWVRDYSHCDKELSNLYKAVGGRDREALYEAEGRVHLAIARCLEQFASNTKMAYYTRGRMTFNNECFHFVINKYCTKRLNFPKSYEALSHFFSVRPLQPTKSVNRLSRRILLLIAVK